MRNRIPELWKRFVSFMGKVIQGARTWLVALYLKVKDVVKKIRRRVKLKRFHKKKLSMNFTPELESVVTALLDDTIGEGGALDWEFQRQIDYYRRKKQPIGEPQAREILMNLLKVAASDRERLNGRLEQCVEVGELYNRYYSKLQTVYDLDVKTENARLEMELAENEYNFLNNVYLNARNTVYGKDFTRQYQGGADTK